MSLIHVIILAVIQGLAELLPVSSSAHVIVAAKLLHDDTKSVEFTLLLVMLHTGTMFAVIVYFWKQWVRTFFASAASFVLFAKLVVVATLLTGLVGYPIQKAIEHQLAKGQSKAEIEQIFDRLNLIAPALAAAGVLILFSGLKGRKNTPAVEYEATGDSHSSRLTLGVAAAMGAVQGLCLPFRGFSRSGATISTGLLAGSAKERVEAFSFALAVVLTPPVVAREVLRVLKARHEAGTDIHLGGTFAMSMLGMVCAFLAGLVALKWLSRWLEGGRWYLFGIYCLIAAVVVQVLYFMGY